MSKQFSTSEIDRLGARLREDETAADNLRQLDAYRRTYSEAYTRVISTLRDELKLELTGRPAKSTKSLVDKLRRESVRLSQVQDIAGCRIIVDDIVVQSQVSADIQAALPISRIVDRRTSPSFGYRAIHLIALIDGMSVEIQLRSALQHLWAEVSEKLSDVLDPSIKYGGGPDELQGLLLGVAELIAQFEKLEIGELELAKAHASIPSMLAEFASARNALAAMPPTPKRDAALSTAGQQLEDHARSLEDSETKLTRMREQLMQLRADIETILREIVTAFMTIEEENDAVSD